MHIFNLSVTLFGFVSYLNFVHSNEETDSAARVKRGALCGGTMRWGEGDVKIKTKITNGGETICSFHAVGTEICHPEIICPKVDLKGNDEEGLVISDAIGGELRLIAKEAFTKPKIGSGGARDLFVEFKSSTPGQGFECEIGCGNGKGDPLPESSRKRKEQFKCVCGLQNKDNRIVGGEDAQLNEFPWQVALVKPGTREPYCGGTVINSRYILTAAHCFVLSGIGPAGVEILHHAQLLDFTVIRVKASKDAKLGEEGSMQARGFNMTQKTDADEMTKRYKVVKIINHPLFNQAFDYDVSLLQLEKKIDLSAEDAPTPICLPKPADYQNLYEGTKPTVAGWGLGDEIAGATTRLLQKLEVPVISYKKCKELIPKQLTMRMICAGFLEGGKDSCIGDSGGPLFLKNDLNKQWTQIGIVSWGEGCARKNALGYYSRVTELLQWIYHHTEQPDVEWCRTSK